MTRKNLCSFGSKACGTPISVMGSITTKKTPLTNGDKILVNIMGIAHDFGYNIFMEFNHMDLMGKNFSYFWDNVISKRPLCLVQCRKTYCWSFNSPIILMCKSFGQRLIDNHLWRSKSRRQLLNIGCHKNSLQSWRIGPFLNTCSSLDLSLMNLWLLSCKLIIKANW